MNHLKIYVKEDFSSLPSLLVEEKEIFLIYDSHLTIYADEILHLCPGAKSLAINTSEVLKNMDSVMHICKFLLENGASRHSIVLALGGGITTDMAGFAASIYKRGVRFVNIPTTLLAQVDAAIGGKTGVNLEGYKNMLGVINQPEFTYVSGHVLASLPNRDMLSGVAEMLKTFILCDQVHYDMAIEQLKRGERPSTDLIEAAAMIKAGVVERDEKENGERRTLNLGHSVAHVIEWWQTEGHLSDEQASELTDYSHGEAVAIGLVQAARLSEKLGVCERGLENRLKEDFKSVCLPYECPIPVETIDKAIRQDKKAEGQTIHFILIKKIGEVEDRILGIDDVIKGLS